MTGEPGNASLRLLQRASLHLIPERVVGEVFHEEDEVVALEVGPIHGRRVGRALRRYVTVEEGLAGVEVVKVGDGAVHIVLRRHLEHKAFGTVTPRIGEEEALQPRHHPDADAKRRGVDGRDLHVEPGRLERRREPGGRDVAHQTRKRDGVGR